MEAKSATSSSRNASTSRCASINLRAVEKQQHFIIAVPLQYCKPPKALIERKENSGELRTQRMHKSKNA